MALPMSAPHSYTAKEAADYILKFAATLRWSGNFPAADGIERAVNTLLGPKQPSVALCWKGLVQKPESYDVYDKEPGMISGLSIQVFPEFEGQAALDWAKANLPLDATGRSQE